MVMRRKDKKKNNDGGEMLVAEMEHRLDDYLARTAPADAQSVAEDVSEIENKLDGILARRVVTPMDSSLIDAMRRQLDRTLTVSDIENQLNDILADGKISPLEAEMLPILSEKLDEALGRPRTEPVSYGNRTTAPETPHDRGERAAACPYDSAADDIPLPPSVAVDPLLPDEPASGQVPADTAPDKVAAAAGRTLIPMGGDLYFNEKDGRVYRKRARRGLLGGKLRR